MDISFFKNKSFIMYLLGQVISSFGDGVYLIAFMWLALELSGGQGVVVGGIFSIYTLNEVIFGFIAGPIADKLSKKKILIVIDVLRGLVVMSFFIMTKYLSITVFHLYAVTFLFSVLSPFFHRTEFSIVPQLIHRERLLRANGFLGGTRKIVQIISPGLAGVLIGVIGIETCFFLDALTFFISVICITFVKLKYDVKSTKKNASTLFRDIKNGWMYLSKSKLLLTIGFYAACINFLAGPIIPLLALLSAKYSIGSSGYGLIMSALSIGFIISSYCIGFFDKHVKKVHLMLIGLLISAGSIFMFGIFSGYITIVVIAFLLGVGLNTSNLPIVVLIQLNTPKEKIGVISSFVFTLSQAAQPISIALGGFLASIIPLSTIFINVGIILSVGVLLGFFLPQLHQSDTSSGKDAVMSY